MQITHNYFEIILESNYSTNGKEFLNEVLSEDARRYRRKTISVNIKITFLSWALECMGGIGAIVVWVFIGNESFQLYGLFLQILGLIIIPCTYILNRETTKQIIVLENWMKGIQSTFMTVEEAQSEIQRLQRQN